jgi:hypothetical protein
MTHPLRRPCQCGATEGTINTRNGQDCVFCAACGKYQYNAPKTETGRKPRTVANVHTGISASQRTRILTRATGRCELCGAGGNLHVGHLLSVEVGLKHGLADTEINADENLAALCDTCNLGMGKEVVPLRLAIAMILARTRFAHEG